MLSGLPPYEGIAELAVQSQPLWVFSLNCDLMVELLALHCRIPLRDGFWPDEAMTITRWPSRRPRWDTLVADVISEENLKRGHLHLFGCGQHGINLLKLHGSLDVFAFRDGCDLCRLRPHGQGLRGILAPLHSLNDEIGNWTNGRGPHLTNEIVYADTTGEMQFLRRTLLAGVHKFEKHEPQVMPHRMLDLFRSSINYVTRLYAVGYSFRDGHVNRVLRDWLEFSEGRSLVIANPNQARLPIELAHVAPQVTLRRQSAGDFFASFRRKPLTVSQRLKRGLRSAIRACTGH